MDDEINNCLSLNIFTSKLKIFFESFREALRDSEIEKSLELKKKIEKVLIAANKFSSDALGALLEEEEGFAHVGEFRQGFAVAMGDNPQIDLLINRDGDVIEEASQINPSGNNGWMIRLEDGSGYFSDYRGKELGLRFNSLKTFKDGFALVKRGDNYFFIDRSYCRAFGDYVHAKSFKNGFAAVFNSSTLTWSFIDTTGKKVCDTPYEIISDFSEGLYAGAVVSIPPSKPRRNVWLWTYKNLQGENIIQVDEIIPKSTFCVFANPFSEGIAILRLQDQQTNEYSYMYIDKGGKAIVIDDQIESAEDFKHGLARVKINGKNYYIDKTGQKAFGGREFVGNKKFDDDGYMLVGDRRKEDRWMDVNGKFYTDEEMKKIKGYIYSPEDVEEFFKEIDGM